MGVPKEQLHGARVKLEGLKVVMLPYSSIPFPSSPGPYEAGSNLSNTWLVILLQPHCLVAELL